MVTTNDAVKAWETLDGIIDNDVEKSMTILCEFLEQEGK